MISKQSHSLNTTSLTLGSLINVALQVLPPQLSAIKVTLDQLLQYEDLMVIPFSNFVLDSRKLDCDIIDAGSSSNSQPFHTTLKPAFILLKSQTQPASKSLEYAYNAQSKVAFIISEIPLNIKDSNVHHVAQQNDKAIDNSEINPAGASNQGNPLADSSASASPILCVPNIRDVLGTLVQLSLLNSNQRQSLRTYNDLVQQFPKVVAVTGTNGKTTISQLVAQLCTLSTLKDLQDSAVMGTAGNGRLNNLVQSTHTTGDVIKVQSFLHDMATQKIDILALEASSHGLHQQRLQGVPIQVAIYTNLSRDHLDYHDSMQDYAQAKANLFDTKHFPALTHAIINIDDKFAPLMLETATQSGLEVWTYSLDAKKSATFKAFRINPSLNGVEIELVTHFGTIWLNSPLLGRFNVANLLAAVAAVIALGVKIENISDIVTQLHGANGRMQKVTADDADKATGCFIVDYAHTSDALSQVLLSLKPHCEGKLWAVFGCGGDRDRGKRPLMAQAGLAVADKVILTSDNPRSEDPNLILEDMMQGMTIQQQQNTQVIVDRRQAIHQAVKQADANDIVVIAGKGHETYQEVNGVRHDFDDRVVLKEAFKI